MTGVGHWLVEQGIGEERAVLLDKKGIGAARLRWPGRMVPGEVADAVVVERFAGTNRAIVRFENGEEAFARRLPATDSIGRSVRVEVERAAIAERGRMKRSTAVRSDRPLAPAPTLLASLQQEGHEVTVVHRFPPEADWEELIAEAWTGEVPFSGGTLLLADTPAMTVIDVDGTPPEAIVFNAVPALARTLRRFDMGGNVGIDFPTLSDRHDRKVVDMRLADALSGWPHERTAMNGFGFVQIVARLRGPSILRMVGRDRVGATARLLVRRAEAIVQPGALLLKAHPAVIARISADWKAELAIRTGREVRLDCDPALAIEHGFAQSVPR